MNLALKWPIRLITLDAMQDKYKWYEKIGFKFFDRSKIDSGDYTIPMYMDCLKDVKAVENYINNRGVCYYGNIKK